MTKALRIGGFVSGAILIAFGVVVIVLAINAHSTVTDSLKDEKIVGSAGHEPVRHRGSDEGGGSQWRRRSELRRCR